MGPESRAVARAGGEMLKQAHQADGPVRHHEEHGDDLRHGIDVAQGDKHEADGARDDGRDDGLVVGLPSPLQAQADGLGENPVHRQGLKGPGRNDHAAEGAGHGRCSQSHGNQRRPQSDGFHVELIPRQLLRAGAHPELERHEDVDHDAGHGGPQGAPRNGGGRVLEVSTQAQACRDAREGRKNEGEDFNEGIAGDQAAILRDETRVDGSEDVQLRLGFAGAKKETQQGHHEHGHHAI